MQKSFAVTAIIAVLAQQVAADKCYGLALSSGDQNAIYQAGAIKGLIGAGEEVGYQAISGVAGGALNAAILANYAVGQEEAAADRMKTFWENSTNDKLWKSWLGREAEGLMFKGGLWNDAPALDWLKTEMADIKPTQRWIDVGLTNVLQGTYIEKKQEDLTGDAFYNVMFAQFADAGIFPPAEFDDTDFFDGSTIWDLDIFSVVVQCQALGYADADIVVDTMMTAQKTLKQVDASDYNSISMLWRYLAVSRYYSSMDGLLRAQFAYPNITFRHTLAPTADMPGSMYPLNLNQKNVDEIWDLGVTDGTAAAANPSSTADISQYYSLVKTQHQSVKNGVSFDQFLSMKQSGEIENFNVLENKAAQSMFLQ